MKNYRFEYIDDTFDVIEIINYECRDNVSIESVAFAYLEKEFYEKARIIVPTEKRNFMILLNKDFDYLVTIKETPQENVG